MIDFCILVLQKQQLTKIMICKHSWKWNDQSEIFNYTFSSSLLLLIHFHAATITSQEGRWWPHPHLVDATNTYKSCGLASCVSAWWPSCCMSCPSVLIDASTNLWWCRGTLVILPVLLVELFASHLRFLVTDVELGARGKEEARAASAALRGRTVIDLHRDRCSADICSELYVYVVGAAPEKHMSVYALPSISGMIIVCSVLFCTAHHLCNF